MSVYFTTPRSKSRTGGEARFASLPEEDKGLNGPLTIGKSVAAPPRVETKKEAGQRSQEGSSDEHSDKYCPPKAWRPVQ